MEYISASSKDSTPFSDSTSVPSPEPMQVDPPAAPEELLPAKNGFPAPEECGDTVKFPGIKCSDRKFVFYPAPPPPPPRNAKEELYFSLPKLSGFCFNPGHEAHYNAIHTEHPENGNRITAACRRMYAIGAHNIWNDQSYGLDSNKKSRRQMYKEIKKWHIHTSEYLKKLRATKKQTLEEITTWCTQFDSIQMTPSSYNIAMDAAAYSCYMTTLVAQGRLKNGFALVRPPGHHAHSGKPEGFCVLNNVAVSNALALNQLNCKRTMIIDTDIHHGNGTQQIFYESENVLYVSIHRYEYGRYWPHQRYSDFDHIGDGEGRGHNINIPINENGGTHHDYMFIFLTVVLPIAREFRPDMIFISAGFDSCIGDPIGYMDVYPEVFSQYIYHLSTICNGKIVMILEGGYNHSGIALCTDVIGRTLLGEKPPSFKLKFPRKSTVTSVLNAISMLRNYWPVMYSFHNLAPFAIDDFKHTTSMPMFVRLDGISTNDETGDLPQSSVRDMLNNIECVPMELPTTTIYGMQGDYSTYPLIEHKPERPENQYTFLREVVTELMESTDRFKSAIYTIKYDENRVYHQPPPSEGPKARKKTADGGKDTSGSSSSQPLGPPVSRSYATSRLYSTNPASYSGPPKKRMRVIHARVSRKRRWNPHRKLPEVHKRPPPRGIVLPDGNESLGSLVENTTIYALSRFPRQRILIVNWGFSNPFYTGSLRSRIIDVSVNKPQEGTATFLACDLVRSVTTDGLLSIIDRLIIPAAFEFHPDLVILALQLDNETKAFNDDGIVRSLIWHMQGVFNTRFLLLIDGKDKDNLGFYAGDIYYGKNETDPIVTRPRQKMSESAMRSVLECIMKNDFPQKRYIRSLVRRFV